MNVFLGEPSDTVISFVDKRYYKHTVDAMNVDVSACYKVCEEKSAEIPAEKTSSNLSATIQSIKTGYTEGDIAVPVTGNIIGVDSDGYSIRGDVRGGVCGTVGCGSGTAVYTVCGDVGGNVCGAVLGSVGCGSGTAVCGDVVGNVYGAVLGSVGCGSGTAVYTVCGNVCGAVYGAVLGSVGCGSGTAVCGDVCGDILGWFKPTNVTTSTVLTLDQTSGEDTLLKIDVCGTQYFIHAN